MTKAAFERIKAGLLDAIDYVEGRRSRDFQVWEIPPSEIRAARKRLDLSQAEFADRFGFSVKNLQKWEQGVCRPSGAARAFLQVIAREPRAVTGHSLWRGSSAAPSEILRYGANGKQAKLVGAVLRRAQRHALPSPRSP